MNVNTNTEGSAVSNNNLSTEQLLRRLDELKRDKVRIEAALEAESENIVNRLSRQLKELQTELGIQTPGSSSVSRQNSQSSRARSASRDRRSPRFNTHFGGSNINTSSVSPVVFSGSGNAHGSLPATPYIGPFDSTYLDALKRENELLRMESERLKRNLSEVGDKYNKLEKELEQVRGQRKC